MAQLPYIPDDERFYTNAEEGGRLMRGYQDQIGQNNAQTIKDIGSMYGSALGDLPGDFMTGARFKTDQERAGQQMRYADTAEERAASADERTQELHDLDVPYYQGRNANQTEENRYSAGKHAYEEGAATPAELNAAGTKGQPGMTRRQLADIMGNTQGAANLGATKAGTASTMESVKHAQYLRSRGVSEDAINDYLDSLAGGSGTTSTPPQQAAPASKNSGMNLAGLGDHLANTFGGPPASAPAYNSGAEESRLNAAARASGRDPSVIQGRANKAASALATQRKQTEMGNRAASHLDPIMGPRLLDAAKTKQQLEALDVAMMKAKNWDTAHEERNWTGRDIIASRIPGGRTEAQDQILSEVMKALHDLGSKSGLQKLTSGLNMNVAPNESLQAATRTALEEMSQKIHAEYDQDIYSNQPDVQNMLTKLDTMVRTARNGGAVDVGAQRLHPSSFRGN